MTEMLLETKTLPEELSRLVSTDNVKAIQVGDEIHLMPVAYAGKGCPLRGIGVGKGMSSEEFMARKRVEKELRQ